MKTAKSSFGTAESPHPMEMDLLIRVPTFTAPICWMPTETSLINEMPGQPERSSIQTRSHRVPPILHATDSKSLPIAEIFSQWRRNSITVNSIGGIHSGRYAGVRDPEDTDFQVDKGYDDGKWVWTGDTSDVAGKIKEIPNLPIVVMASTQATLKVSVGGEETPQQKHSDSRPVDAQPTSENARERWNDYGIGLLLQGDLKAAETAFLKVTEIEPTYLDGWVNVARVRIREGDMQGAEAMLEKAFEIQKTLSPENPHRAKVHYFYALIQEADGNYDTAIEHLQRAVSQFPRDTRVRNKLGRMHFLKRNYETALSEFQKTLTVDPEDLDAHYNMMRCYRALKNPSLAAKSQKLYLRFKADESVDAITGIPRRADPDVNRERQRIHEHTNSYEPLPNP